MTPENDSKPLIAAALAAAVAFAALCAVIQLTPQPASRITRIAFGSCNNSGALDQPMWQAVLQSKPDLWAWIGDAIYADTTNIGLMRSYYQQQRKRPEYQALLRRVPVIGVWDDHDYGANNSGKEYPARVQSQQAFLDFIGEPGDSPRRSRAGIYTSYNYGNDDQRLKIILLDTRYHRDRPGPGADLLGAEQWRWLEAELAEPETDLVLLVSSIAVLPREVENWGGFPAAASRLRQLILKNAAPIVLLSGDIHLAELSKAEAAGLRWPLYELTSSGLTHTTSATPGFRNPYRVGKLFTRLNFGLVNIRWGDSTIDVTLEIRDIDNKVQISDTVSFRR